MTRDDALSLLSAWIPAAHPRTDTALLCGSTARNEATPASDVDVVLLFEHLPGGASRETLAIGGTLVEAFLHDPGTLAYFITDLDGAAGIGTLANLVSEGIPVPGFPCRLLTQAKRLADESIAAGPPRLTGDAADRRRHIISSLADDLTPDLGQADRIAVAAELYIGLADYTLRMAGRFSGNGKALSRQLARHDPDLASDLAAALTALIAEGNAAPLQATVDRALSPHGGRLLESYRATAPGAWRR